MGMITKRALLSMNAGVHKDWMQRKSEFG